MTFEQLSQPLLAHEETVIAYTESKVEDVEAEVMREVRTLISDFQPEGWVEIVPGPP